MEGRELKKQSNPSAAQEKICRCTDTEVENTRQKCVHIDLPGQTKRGIKLNITLQFDKKKLRHTHTHSNDETKKNCSEAVLRRQTVAGSISMAKYGKRLALSTAEHELTDDENMFYNMC